MAQHNRKIFKPNEHFFNEHITFTSVPDITLIAKPLQAIGINYFTFDRTYQDGSHIRLTTAGAWIEHYYRDRLYDAAIFEQSTTVFSEGYIFWSWLKREPIYSQAALYDIDHGLTITQPHQSYCDFFHFGTSQDTPIATDELVSRLPELHKFIALFKHKALHIIREAENTALVLPVSAHANLSIDEIRNINNTNSMNILDHNEIKRLYLGSDFDDAYLTAKEIEVLSYLQRGYKPISVANTLQMSERTIETHIKNLKNKLKCKTLFELGFVTHNLGIHNVFPICIDHTNKKEELNDGIMA